MKSVSFLAAIFLCFGIGSAWFSMVETKAERSPAFHVTTAHSVRDVFRPAAPSSVTIGGFASERLTANANGWLMNQNTDSLLFCFTHRPGAYGYQGEHAGKWIHAATLAWANSGSTRLRTKLDTVVRTLLAAQRPGGYLGTYRAGFHWAMGKEQRWDVWVHKYVLLGLLTYAQYTGDKDALRGAVRIGDLLVRTFGPGGKLRLNKRSTHKGMASGSLLEPIVVLYRMTGDLRYLQFATWIVEQWEKPEGSHLVTLLLKHTRVDAIGGGKAYEMLSCLTGLCELYGVTGDDRLLTSVENAWSDIRLHQLLPTGSGSNGEFWIPAGRTCTQSCTGLAEVCVTVSWLELNQQLLLVTGNVRYADEMEKTFYNHLTAAQKPDGSGWSYFTNLSGTRMFTTKETCCSSSGPRGLVYFPMYTYLLSEDGFALTYFTSSSALLILPSGDTVRVQQETDYPRSGKVHIAITVSRPVAFRFSIRVPAWSSLVGLDARPGSFYTLDRTWTHTTRLSLLLDLAPRVLTTRDDGKTFATILRGPQVLAERLPASTQAASTGAFVLPDKIPLQPTDMIDSDRQPVYSLSAIHYLRDGTPVRTALVLSPFSSAGDVPYRVWFPVTAGPDAHSLYTTP